MNRVQDFLLGSVTAATKRKYLAALDALRLKCEEEDVSLEGMSEEQLDWFLADFILDGHLEHHQRNQYGFMLSALAKLNPRCRLRVAWKVLDVWAVKEPPSQAPAVPPELLVKASMMLILAGRAAMGVGFICCYAGLLRAREMLTLKRSDIVLVEHAVIFCLGVTKRGREQKVVLAQPQTVAWVKIFLLSRDFKPDMRPFDFSYTTGLKWLRRAMVAAGAPEIPVTTHSLRRSGASELSRLGVPWQSIMDYGRWNTDRAAREYVRRGEVAVYRAREVLNPQVLESAAVWNRKAGAVWAMAALLEAAQVNDNFKKLFDVQHVDLLNRTVQSWR